VIDRVRIFDTTLRDGEQSPGASLSAAQKLRVARQLARLGVDVIEAGFAAASPDDFAAVRQVAREVRGVTVASFARCTPEDVDAAWEALKFAAQPRIHVCISTSDIHLESQLGISRQQVLAQAVAAVERAKRYCADVEFSPMDATRTEPTFLSEVLEAAISAGATTVNIPDTVGYAQPAELAALIRTIRERVPNIERSTISVHCHDDLGLAVANSLAAIEAGARQVECCVNGIGERAGNAALEETVMALELRQDRYGVKTGVRTTELLRTSLLVAAETGLVVARNKSIVGANAFAHEAGIHQDGMLKDRRTYQIIDAAAVGQGDMRLVLGKHSGRHALRTRLAELGYAELSREQLGTLFSAFKRLADTRKEITDDDLRSLVTALPNGRVA
jgi:2-isopropylmalate synthase